MISAAEKAWLFAGVASDVRDDGRARLDYRELVVETGVLQQTNGSAVVRLGGTRVLVGIKVEVGQVSAAAPGHGRLQCAVDWCGSCRAASVAVHNAAARIEQEERSATLSKRLENTLLPGNGASKDGGGLDLSQLIIVEGRECWVVYVDVLVLGNDGNLFDVMTMAARAALFNTRIPAIELVEGEDGDLEIALSDDPMACKRLVIDNVPICVSLTKIGPHYVIDPTYEEELCMSMQAIVSVDKKGRFCGISKSGRGNLHSSALLSMLESAKRIGLQLMERLDEVLAEEEKLAAAGGKAPTLFL